MVTGLKDTAAQLSWQVLHLELGSGLGLRFRVRDRVRLGYAQL